MKNLQKTILSLSLLLSLPSFAFGAQEVINCFNADDSLETVTVAGPIDDPNSGIIAYEARFNPSDLKLDKTKEGYYEALVLANNDAFSVVNFTAEYQGKLIPVHIIKDKKKKTIKLKVDLYYLGGETVEATLECKTFDDSKLIEY